MRPPPVQTTFRAAARAKKKPEEFNTKARRSTQRHTKKTEDKSSEEENTKETKKTTSGGPFFVSFVFSAFCLLSSFLVFFVCLCVDLRAFVLKLFCLPACLQLLDFSGGNLNHKIFTFFLPIWRVGVDLGVTSARVGSWEPTALLPEVR
jgi:hypothetical protein